MTPNPRTPVRTPARTPRRPLTWRLRDRVLAGVAGALAVAILGTNVFFLTYEESTTTVSIDDLIADGGFGQDASDGTVADPGDAAPTPAASTPDDAGDPASGGPSAGPSVGAPAEGPGTEVGDTADRPEDAAATDSAPTSEPPAADATAPAAATEPAATEAAAPPAAPAFVRPAEGVYTYLTSGGEQVSLAGARHDYPEETYAAIRHRDGCEWYMDHRFVEEHREDRVYCSAGDQVTLLEIGTEVTFFGQTETSDYRCDPPRIVVDRRDAVGSKRSQTCTAEDGRSEETATHHGQEVLVIGGAEVAAWHVSFDAVISGRAQGTAHSDVWVHPDTGLVLKVIRDIETASNAFGADVVYTEQVEYTLKSLTPRT